MIKPYRASKWYIQTYEYGNANQEAQFTNSTVPPSNLQFLIVKNIRIIQSPYIYINIPSTYPFSQTHHQHQLTTSASNSPTPFPQTPTNSRFQAHSSYPLKHSKNITTNPPTTCVSNKSSSTHAATRPRAPSKSTAGELPFAEPKTWTRSLVCTVRIA